jgi:formyltetrahydrofolate synthetase
MSTLDDSTGMKLNRLSGDDGRLVIIEAMKPSPKSESHTTVEKGIERAEKEPDAVSVRVCHR